MRSLGERSRIAPALRLIEGSAPAEDEFPVNHGISAAIRLCRPGVAQAPQLVRLDDGTARHVERMAAGAGVPAELWASVAIEAARAVGSVARALGMSCATVARLIDEVELPTMGSDQSEIGFYALDLAARQPRPARAARRDLTLAVPTHMLLSWRLAAKAADETTELWALRQLSSRPPTRIHWEASAAGAGLSLGEFVTVQAASARRR